MAKIETQINQIFLSPGESKKVSLILFEERLAPTQHLFLVAELRDVQKKTELNDLGKISEMIIQRFKANVKLPEDSRFEETLKQINDELGDFAHKGRKSWLGKFSALIALKSDKDFYLANSGHTCAWLKRKNSLNEVLGPDKAETHPLKTFLNFSSGRLAEGDNLVLTTSSIFNYVSVELFSRTLSSSTLEQACAKISDILRSSARSDEGFAVFMLEMTRKLVTAPAAQPALVDVAPRTESKMPAGKVAKPASLARPVPTQPIYAPLPEDMSDPSEVATGAPVSLPTLPKLSLPKLSRLSLPTLRLPRLRFSLRWPQLKVMGNVSGPGKFFLGSFLLFAVLFGMNLAAYGVRKSQGEFNERFNASAEVFTGLLEEAESSLLYKNHSQAMSSMSEAETELAKLAQLDPDAVAPFREKFEEMNNKVNRVTILRNLTPVFETQYPLTTMSRAGSGYLIANENPNSLGLFADGSLRNLFMLNSTDGEMRGIAHVSGVGHMVASKDKIYLANETSKEFEQMEYISGADLTALKFQDPNLLYAINKANSQVIRMAASAAGVTAPTSLLKGAVNLQTARDLAVDNEIFVLYADHLAKYSAAGQPVDFQLATLSEPVHDLTKIRIGNQIYLLEPVSSRLLIFGRGGELLNQVQFPELTDLRDMYVDEAGRQMYLLNGNKVYVITF